MRALLGLAILGSLGGCAPDTSGAVGQLQKDDGSLVAQVAALQAEVTALKAMMGQQGAKGETGPQGPMGDPGPQGVQGPQGTPGGAAKLPHLVAKDGSDLGLYLYGVTAVAMVNGKPAVIDYGQQYAILFDGGNCTGQGYWNPGTPVTASSAMISARGTVWTVAGPVADNVSTISGLQLMNGSPKCFASQGNLSTFPVSDSTVAAKNVSGADVSVEFR